MPPCDACAVRRVKCDSRNPCTWCDQHGQPCTYVRVRRRRGPKGARASTMSKVAEKVQAGQRAVKSPSTEGTCMPVESLTQIPLAQYCTYLDMYQAKLYPIWPVVVADMLKAQLRNEDAGTDVRALAAALCAATILQLRLVDDDNPAGSTSEMFIRECLRHRSTVAPSNKISLDSLLASLFLHIYYANTGQFHTATFALRDAVTYAHLLRLDNLTSLLAEERELRVRIFWILYITERTFCGSHGIPVLLQRIPHLPDPTLEIGHGTCSIAGFCCLIRLFTLSESLLLGQQNLLCRKDELDELYERMNEDVEDYNNGVLLQDVDIQTTRAWLQSLFWQQALSKFLLDSHAPEVQFTPEFPLTVARNLLGFLSHVPLDLIQSHAYAMEVKLCQVGHTLLDIIMIVPSIRRACSLHYGPVDVMLTFENLLRSLFRQESEIVARMRRRMREMDFGQRPLSGLRLLPSVEDDDARDTGGLPLGILDGNDCVLV